MSDDNKARLAHELLDEINARKDLTPEQTEVLRSFLPKRPNLVTLERVFRRANAAWANARGNEWLREEEDLEAALLGLRNDLRSLAKEECAPSKSKHSEYLEAIVDYTNAPVGTIVAADKRQPMWKSREGWYASDTPFDNYEMAGLPRRVLRWGDAK